MSDDVQFVLPGGRSIAERAASAVALFFAYPNGKWPPRNEAIQFVLTATALDTLDHPDFDWAAMAVRAMVDDAIAKQGLAA